MWLGPVMRMYPLSPNRQQDSLCRVLPTTVSILPLETLAVTPPCFTPLGHAPSDRPIEGLQIVRSLKVFTLSSEKDRE